MGLAPMMLQKSLSEQCPKVLCVCHFSDTLSCWSMAVGGLGLCITIELCVITDMYELRIVTDVDKLCIITETSPIKN